jgi:hypothetical protein
MSNASPDEFAEFVEQAAEKFAELSKQSPSPQWAADIRRLAQSTAEVLTTASPLLQSTHLFTDLRILHDKVLELMEQHVGMIDSENKSGSRFGR